jgi:hypothetical protein
MRGIFYTGIIVLILLMILSVLAVQKGNISDTRESMSERQEIMDMDASYRSVERSLHILSDVSLRRAIIATQDSVLSGNRSFFANGSKSPDILRQLMWNGTLPSSGSTIQPFMVNNTLNYNINQLEVFYEDVPRDYNVSIGLDYLNSTVGLSDSFSVYFNGSFQINISKVGVANLSRNYLVFEKVYLTGFEDPEYLVNLSGGKLSRVINKSRYIGNFTQRISLSVLSGSGYCYGGLTSDPSAAQKSQKIFYNQTIYSVDSFCGVIYVSGSSPGTSYLKVSSVAGLSALNGQNLLLLGNGENWVINDGLFNVTNLINHFNEGGYVSSSTAPSFFDELEGNLNCTYCPKYGPVGLETLVDKNMLSTPELHISVNTSASNTLNEYLAGKISYRMGLNESSIDAGFYEFRLANSMKDYFQ